MPNRAMTRGNKVAMSSSGKGACSILNAANINTKTEGTAATTAANIITIQKMALNQASSYSQEAGEKHGSCTSSGNCPGETSWNSMEFSNSDWIYQNPSGISESKAKFI